MSFNREGGEFTTVDEDEAKRKKEAKEAHVDEIIYGSSYIVTDNPVEVESKHGIYDREKGYDIVEVPEGKTIYFTQHDRAETFHYERRGPIKVKIING